MLPKNDRERHSSRRAECARIRLEAEEPLRALIPFDRCALMLPFTDRVG